MKPGIIIGIGSLACMTGCASLPPDASYVGVTLSDQNSGVIAQAISSFVVMHAPPASSTLTVPAVKLDGSGVAGSALPGDVIEDLRKTGYAIAPQGSNLVGAYHLQYLVTPLDGSVLLRETFLTVTASQLFLYDSVGNLIPGSPVTMDGPSGYVMPILNAGQVPAGYGAGASMTPGGMPLVTGASSAPQAVQTSASGAALSRLPTVAVGTVPKPVPSVSAHPAVVASLPPFKPTEVAMRPYTPPAPIWVLPTGALVGVELAAWGKASGWTVQWNVHQDWSVPQAAQFQGNFEVAATAVLKTIAGQGADIRARFYEGNQILVVDQPGGSYAQ